MTRSDVVYCYDALDSSGASRHGVVSAAHERAALELLAQRHLLPTRIAVAPNRRRQRLSRVDTAAGFRALADLLQSGLPLVRALEVFEHTAPQSWLIGLEPMRQAVHEGAALSVALERSQLSLPALLIAVVNSGELANGLAEAVACAARHAERAAQRQAEVRAALAYPITVLAVGGLCLGFLLFAVVPRFGALLADAGSELPFATRLLIGASSFATTAAIPVGALAVATVAVAVALARDGRVRQRFARALLDAPLVGPLRHAALSARILQALSTLLQSGLPVRRALLASAPVADDQEMSRRVALAVERIDRGEGVSRSLAAERVTTQLANRLLRLGEELGSLGDLCARASATEYAEFDRRLSRIVQSAEPALILGLAGVVAAVAVALLQAVYTLRPL